MSGVLNRVLLAMVAISASLAPAQDKAFFSPQYPAAGACLPPASSGVVETGVPRARNSRVVSSDDFKGEETGARLTGQNGQTVRPPNLTRYGVEFDKRHPELWGPQPDLDSIKQQLAQAQPSPTPSSSPAPSATPTHVRIKIGRRFYTVNPTNATLQPSANPSATPVIIVVQPQH
jgi:hypothetical protein